MIITPAYKENNIAIAFASDEKFIPYLYVTLQSLVDNSSKNYNYDIIVLFANPNKEIERRFRSLLMDNISIRFVDVDDCMSRGKDVWYSCGHYSKAMYYRFFIPELFENYNKILYLDSDLIIESDIAELYNIDIGENYVGAVKDVNLLIDKKLSSYVKTTLSLAPSEYFNSGVMLFNVDKLKNINFVELCLDKLKQLTEPHQPDQDVLNIVCLNNVKYLGLRYNLFQSNIQDVDFCDKLPADIVSEFISASNDFAILHYAGWKKPWKNPKLFFSDYFWKYARKSSYYEEILYSNSGITSEQLENVLSRKKIYLKYLFFKILKLITIGKLKKYCLDKSKELKINIDDYRTTLNRRK